MKTPSITLDFILKLKTTGQQLLNRVAGLLDLREVRFFGLQFVDYKGTSTWLGPSETLSSQRVRKESPLHFQLKVRFWPRDVYAQVSDETALVLFFRQLQEMVDSGELCCPSSTAAQLAAYAAQVQYGDFVEDLRHTRYTESFVPPGTTGSEGNRLRTSPEAQAAWQLKVACLHRNNRGLSQRDALREFFKLAQELPTYGVTHFEVTTELGTELWLGVTADGINVYEDKLTPKLSFHWSVISSTSYDGRKFTIKRIRGQSTVKHVFYTSRKQVCMNIMVLARGYFALRRRQQRSNAVPTSHTSGGTVSFRTCRLNLDDAERSESSSSGPASEGATSGDSSRPASSGDGGEGLSVPRTASHDSTTNTAGEDSDTPDPGSAERNTPGENRGAAFFGDSDESDTQDAAVAGARSSSDAAGPLPVSDNEGDTAVEGPGAESDGETSSDERNASEAIGAGERHRRNPRERGLSLSASENWGPFSESLMAPD